MHKLKLLSCAIAVVVTSATAAQADICDQLTPIQGDVPISWAVDCSCPNAGEKVSPTLCRLGQVREGGGEVNPAPAPASTPDPPNDGCGGCESEGPE